MPETIKQVLDKVWGSHVKDMEMKRRANTVRLIEYYNGDQEKQPLYFPDFNIAFTYAIQELKILWRWYRMAYEKEMGK